MICPIFAAKKLSNTIKIGTNKVPERLFEMESIFKNPEIINTESSNLSIVLLQNKKLDIALVPLEEVPVALDKKLVIAGLSERKEPSYRLLINKRFFQKKAVFKLEKNLKVVTDNLLAGLQLQHFRSDLSISIQTQTIESLHALLAAGTCAALLLSADKIEVKPEIWQDFHSLFLNPREFITAPGQGVLAYLARREDTPIRRELLQLHRPASAEITNIERKILKLQPDYQDFLTGAFGKKDDAGNYHLWAVQADPTKKTCRHFQVSSSTTVELAEKVVAGLNASETT